MFDSLDWLPPGLHPVAMRIARADECAYAMGELAARWSFDGPLDLVQVRRGDRITVRVRMIRPIPPRISLLFSEAVNHLRAALDNVIWHLVEVAQGPVAGRAALKVHLPIFDDEAGFDRWCRDRVGAGLTAFDSTATLGQRVRSLQPFVDLSSEIPSMEAALTAFLGTAPELAHPLKLLQGYSNGDKHRTIRVTLPRTSGGRVDQLWADSRRFVELQVGDVVSDGIWGQRVDFEQTTAVQIERPAPYTALVAPGQEVSRLAAYVAHVAIPHLVTGLALPGSLPMKVDLDDSGIGDLERLMAGDRQPAGERLIPWMNAKYVEAVVRPVQYLPIVEEQISDDETDR